MASAIEVHGLVKNFVLPFSRKKIPALRGLSFQVEEGNVVGFLGANGAGKTTALKIILRLIFPDAGTVKIYGKSHHDLTQKQRIGFLTERPYFYDYLTGREFLTFCAKLFRRHTPVEKLNALLLEVGLDRAADRPLRRYSKGMLQRIGIAQALVNDPSLLILDEPMSGLDPDGRADMIKLIKKAHQRGATIFFSSHLLSDMESLCDRIVMIDRGHLIVESTVIDLLSKHSKGYALELAKDEKMEHLHFEREDDLQSAIDRGRRDGFKIVKVLPLRPTLEEVFLKMKKNQA